MQSRTSQSVYQPTNVTLFTNSHDEESHLFQGDMTLPGFFVATSPNCIAARETGNRWDTMTIPVNSLTSRPISDLLNRKEGKLVR